MSLGEVAQAVAAFVMVQTALNWLVDNYPSLAECLSSVNRVGSLLVALDQLDGGGEPRVQEGAEDYEPDTVDQSGSDWAVPQPTRVFSART